MASLPSVHGVPMASLFGHIPLPHIMVTKTELGGLTSASRCWAGVEIPLMELHSDPTWRGDGRKRASRVSLVT